jgi:hypothetical protein
MGVPFGSYLATCGGCELKVDTINKKDGKDQLYLECRECVKSCGAKIKPDDFYVQPCLDLEANIGMSASGQLVCQKLFADQEEVDASESYGSVLQSLIAKTKSLTKGLEKTKWDEKFDLKNIDPKIFNFPHSEF